MEPAYGIGFPRRGVYVHETPNGRIVADPTVALLRSLGDEQTTTHPTIEGDRNTEIHFPSAVIEPLLDLHGRFRQRFVSVSDPMALAHQRLLACVLKGTASTLEVEERAMSLVRQAHAAAPGSPVAHRRQLVDDTREQLGISFRENVDLATIAARVGSSPYHLSRTFRESTGMTLSGYRTTLPVRHVLEHLAGGADDLARAAVEAGFYDHAHLSRTFALRLGFTPSYLRHWLSRQKRKDLQAPT
jgi:AraC-like DNA-binding protein